MSPVGPRVVNIIYTFYATPTRPYGQYAIRRTTNLDGGLQLEENGLRNEDFPRLYAEKADFILSQGDLLPRTASADCVFVIRSV